MSVEGIKQLQNAIGNVANKEQATSSQVADFSDMVSKSLESVLDSQETAEKLSTQAMQKPESVDMHELISAVSQAELQLQTMVSIRDKAVAAYNKIMDMPL